DAAGVRGGDLERGALIIVPAAQVDALALAAGFGHAEHLGEELERLVWLGREDLDMAEMRQIQNGFTHRRLLRMLIGRDCGHGYRPGKGRARCGQPVRCASPGPRRRWPGHGRAATTPGCSTR